MIVYEEETPLTEGFEPIFPVGVTLTAEGDRTVTAFPSCRDAAEYLDALPAEELFTSATQEALLAMLDERLAAWGYCGITVPSTAYRLTDRQQINRNVLLPSSEVLLPDHGYENLTDCDPSNFIREDTLCFGTVIDGKILSGAAENPHAEGDTVIDIGVETAEGYEGNGYAASNVAALSYYLLDPGMTVTYTAIDYNKPSCRVAEKVGFTPHTRELRVVAWKREDD
jgi:hypothetical protein